MSDCSVWQNVGIALLVPVAVLIGFVLAFVIVGVAAKLVAVMEKFWPLVLVALLAPVLADAASIKVCYDPASVNADVATLLVIATATSPVFNGTIGSNAPVGSGCFTFPVPAQLPRTTFSVTLVAQNTLGEVGPASNAISFRLAAVPPAPALLSVGGTATP